MIDKDIHINEVFLEIKKHVTNGGLDYTFQTELLKAELAYSLKVPESDILTALCKMSEVGIDINYKNFQSEKKCLLPSDKISEFIFYSLINYSMFENIDILGKHIKRVDQKDEQVILDKIRKVNSHIDFFENEGNLLDEGFFFIETKIESYDFEDAFLKYYSVYSLLKSVLEFVLQSGLHTFFFGANKKILAKLPHTPFIFYLNNKASRLVLFYDHYATDLEQVPHNATNLSFAKKLLNFFKDDFCKSDLKFLLADCFRLYNKGIDNLYTEYRFLFLWNALEKLTCSEQKGGKTDEVIKRIKPFDEKFCNMYCNYLKHLAEMRNNLVHKGINEVDDLSVNVLKILLETCLRVLISKFNELPTINHLNQFYMLWSETPTNLNVLKEVIDVRLKHLSKKNK